MEDNHSAEVIFEGVFSCSSSVGSIVGAHSQADHKSLVTETLVNSRTVTNRIQ